ncbi:MAG: GTPase Der [Patescibacteria group bacterium]|nr:GTPase Der [Patescibacteria group bacterium]
MPSLINGNPMSLASPSPLPRVALVGRTNVGKSTLWNKFTEQPKALTSSESHTTRDRHYGLVTWRGDVFELTDTGGMDVESNDVGEGIYRQSEQAIKEADLVIFVGDTKTGPLPEDRDIVQCARTYKKHPLLIVNKCDKQKDLTNATADEWRQLGLGEPHPVSAVTSLGVGDLLDLIQDKLKEIGKPARPHFEVEALRIALVGRPNVGKSSLTNAILGEERVIVSPVAHTTREPQDTMIRYQDRDIVLVDTAGMRKAAKVDGRLEEEGIRRNKQAIDDADIAFLVFDATQDPTAQDRHLAGLMEYERKGLVLVANKWDLVKNKTTKSPDAYEKLIRQCFPFLSWAPIVFTSALEKQRVKNILDLALEVQNERHRKIDYNAINRVLKACIKTMKPLASYGPKSPRIYDVAQIGSAPPHFLITVVGEKDNLHPNWIKFFEKRVREKFGFVGTPIIVKAQHIPNAKSSKSHNVHGPGMEAAVGKIREKPRLVNQTMRRQKYR